MIGSASAFTGIKISVLTGCLWIAELLTIRWAILLQNEKHIRKLTMQLLPYCFLSNEQSDSLPHFWLAFFELPMMSS
jgi:hypothetical protein